MNILTHLNGLLQLNGESMADLNSYTLAQPSGGIGESLLLIAAVAGIIVLLGTAAYWASR